MSLFDIRLNEEGTRAIKKFEKFARWAMTLTIIISVIMLLEAWTTFFLTLQLNYGDNKLILLQNRAYPFYLMVYIVLVYVQIHYYLKTGRQLSASIDNNDEAAFNRSFITLFRNSFFCLLSLSLAVLMVVFRIFVFIASYYW